MILESKEGDGGREGERERERERERGERETSICCLTHSLQPQVEPTAFLCKGQCSNQLSHPARGRMCKILIYNYKRAEKPCLKIPINVYLALIGFLCLGHLNYFLSLKNLSRGSYEKTVDIV